MIGLPDLSPKQWFRVANGGYDQSGEWVASSMHIYEMRLTDWPFLPGSSWAYSFAYRPQEELPIEVKATLSVDKKYGGYLYLKVNGYHYKNLIRMPGRTSLESAKRQALAYLYDRQLELVQEALRAFWNEGVYGARCLILDETGLAIATFPNSSDAFNSSLLPKHFYEWRWDHYTKTMRAYEVRREGSSTMGSGGPDITERVTKLMAAREEVNDTR